MTRLALIAATGYTAGLALGTVMCHLGWVLVSHESRFRL